MLKAGQTTYPGHIKLETACKAHVKRGQMLRAGRITSN